MIFSTIICWVLLVAAVAAVIYFITEEYWKISIPFGLLAVLCIICLVLLRIPPTETVEDVTTQKIIKISSSGDTTVTDVFIVTYDGNKIFQTTDPRIQKGSKILLNDEDAYLKID